HRYWPRCRHYISKEHRMTQEFFNNHLSAIDPRTLYKILQLRTDVFVVEQNCPYPELDGRDLEPDCELLWATVDGEIAGTTRILHYRVALCIGPVVVAPHYRGTGIARELYAFTLERCALIDSSSTFILDAQAPLQG